MTTVFDSSFQTFLTRAESTSAIAHLLHKMGHAIPFNRGANYFTLKDDGRISYLLGAKEKTQGRTWGYDVWNDSGRTVAKAPRAMKNLLPDVLASQFTDVDFEVFSDHVKSFVERGTGTFRIVENTDIPYWYHWHQYEDGDYFDIGTLRSSCMRYDETMPYLDFYTTVPNVSMVIYTSEDDKLLGRALLWSFEDGTFMDRIYGSAPTQNSFLTYASENGWYTREEQSFRNPTHWVDPEGEPVTRKVQIALLNEPEWNLFPYLDTFSYVSVTGHYLTNDPMDQQAQYLSQSTQGSLELHKSFNRRCSCGTYLTMSELWESGSDRQCVRCRSKGGQTDDAVRHEPDVETTEAPMLFRRVPLDTATNPDVSPFDDDVDMWLLPDDNTVEAARQQLHDMVHTSPVPTFRYTYNAPTNRDEYTQIVDRMIDTAQRRREFTDPWA
jgi:hypothetical protein